MKEVIKSNNGFYIGDICYALADDIYSGIWGKWGYCDGEYVDQNGRLYGVDAGVIGLVPLELVKPEYRDGGQIFAGAGDATFEACNGFFSVSLPNGTVIQIDSDCAKLYDEDYEEEY